MPELPQPDTKGHISVESALVTRRSCRNFSNQPLSEKQISQLLWAGQGITYAPRGFRTAPSAGATFPISLYAILPEGTFKYDPQTHNLIAVQTGDIRHTLAAACLEQFFMTSAGLIIVIAANFKRTTSRYGQRGKRYVILEAGHFAENIFLQAQALGLGSVAIGAYDDKKVAKIVKLDETDEPLLIVAIGVKGDETNA